MKTERLAEIIKIHTKMRKECKTWGTEDVYGDQLLAFDDLIKEAEELAELKAKLKEIEHCILYDNTGERYSGCPVCGVEYGGSHENCWLAQVIGC